MILTFVNVAYVLIAVAMIVLILLQRGAGAAAGSGFGAGASATVFGARGASNFLSKSTAVLATLFFALSLGMAIYATRTLSPAAANEDLGVMADAVPTAPASDASSSVPTVQDAAPVATDAAVPAADAAPEDAPAAESSPQTATQENDNGG